MIEKRSDRRWPQTGRSLRADACPGRRAAIGRAQTCPRVAMGANPGPSAAANLSNRQAGRKRTGRLARPGEPPEVVGAAAPRHPPLPPTRNGDPERPVAGPKRIRVLRTSTATKTPSSLTSRNNILFLFVKMASQGNDLPLCIPALEAFHDAVRSTRVRSWRTGGQ